MGPGTGVSMTNSGESVPAGIDSITTGYDRYVEDEQAAYGAFHSLVRHLARTRPGETVYNYSIDTSGPELKEDGPEQPASYVESVVCPPVELGDNRYGVLVETRLRRGEDSRILSTTPAVYVIDETDLPVSNDVFSLGEVATWWSVREEWSSTGQIIGGPVAKNFFTDPLSAGLAEMNSGEIDGTWQEQKQYRQLLAEMSVAAGLPAA